MQFRITVCEISFDDQDRDFLLSLFTNVEISIFRELSDHRTDGKSIAAASNFIHLLQPIRLLRRPRCKLCARYADDIRVGVSRIRLRGACAADSQRAGGLGGQRL